MDTLTTTQHFSRRGIGYLWDNRNNLDPGQVSIINSMYNNRKKGTVECQQTITYRLSSKKAGKLGWGRYYGSKGSLETVEKECRGTLCNDYYYDLDIVNCHYVLLEQFAKNKYNKDLPELSRYVSNREQFLRELGGNRDEAKETLIKILYGGSCKNEFLMPLAAETRSFSKSLSREKEYEELYNACKHEDNVFGTFLSFILQTEERKCMMAMKASLEAMGWKVDVLAYDGVMIRKNEKLELAAAIKACENGIKEATGYCVSVINKEMISYQLPEITEQIVPNVSRGSYEEMKVRFEETHFYHIPSGTIAEVHNSKILFMTLEHARAYLLCDWHFKVSDKFSDIVPFFDLWMKEPKKRKIYSIDMKPSDDSSVYSPPLSFAYSRYDAPSNPQIYVDKFLGLMSSMIPNAEMRNHSLEWLAHIVQKPFENPKSCLILTGGKGCGKDTLGDFLIEWVFGQMYSKNYDSNEQFWAPHDMGRMNKLFVKLEEACGYLNKKHESGLKARITSESSEFNPKGQKEISVANYARYFMTTNDRNPVATDDEERRFAIVSCSSALIGNMDYWRDIRATLFTREGGRAVGDYLAALPCGLWPRKLFISDVAAAMADAQQTSERKFFDAWDGEETSASELFRKYLEFCRENELTAARSSKGFALGLLFAIGDGSLIKWKGRDTTLYRKA
jgi:hypothetical protein